MVLSAEWKQQKFFLIWLYSLFLENLWIQYSIKWLHCSCQLTDIFVSIYCLSQAYNKGKTFKGRALKISWYRTPASPSGAMPTTPTTPTVLKKVEEELGLDVDELVSNRGCLLGSGCGWLGICLFQVEFHLILIPKNKAKIWNNKLYPKCQCHNPLSLHWNLY